MLGQVARLIVNNTSRTGVRSYSGRFYGPANFRPPTMDDLPIPSGSWKEHYDKKQQKYIMHLILGIVTFAATVAVGQVNGYLYLNWAPPTPKSS